MTNAGIGKTLAAFAAFLVIGTALEYSARAQSEQAVLKREPSKERLETARLEVANVRSNVFLTLVELDRVRGEREPEGPRFRAFRAQLGKMQELAKALGQRAQEMKQKGDAYFADEQASAAGQASAQRLVERKRAYDAINQHMQAAKTSFLDFVAVLNEIESLLGGERTPAAAAKAKSIFGKANWTCIDVQKALMYVEQELDNFAATLD